MKVYIILLLLLLIVSCGEDNTNLFTDSTTKSAEDSCWKCKMYFYDQVRGFERKQVDWKYVDCQPETGYILYSEIVDKATGVWMGRSYYKIDC